MTLEPATPDTALAIAADMADTLARELDRLRPTAQEACRMSTATLRGLLTNVSPRRYLYPPLRTWTKDELLTELRRIGALR